jgi:hypothetical protein
MKVIKVIVDEIPTRCMGNKNERNYYPEPCEFLAAGDCLWCVLTGKSIEENNDPYKTRPDWCPLAELDYVLGDEGGGLQDINIRAFGFKDKESED